MCRKLFFRVLLIILPGIQLLPVSAVAQTELPEFDEIIISIKGTTIGSAEIPAIIIGQELYLPVSDLFNFLTIKNSFSAGGDSISGHLMNPRDLYSINRKNNHIIYQEKITRLLPKDLIFSSNEFYLKARYFGEIFNMPCNFNFRSLTVDFNPGIELPFMREKRLEQMRRNITKIKGEIQPDTVIKRQFEAFHLGAVDWNIAAGSFRGKTNVQARMAVGTMLAGGEANAQLSISGTMPFKLKDQYFLWRHVSNDRKLFKQFSVGRLSAPGTFSPVPSILGIQINNSPTRQRRSFGSYFVSDVTEPGWIIELYVNEVLADYTRADASGLFSFEVPLVYGNTNVKYKFYGPWGEERSREQVINIPFAFLPKKRLDYSFTAGTATDTSNNPFSRLHVNYGLAKRITIGSGVEYNRDVVSRHVIPFANVSTRLGNSVILFAEYSPGTFIKTAGNFRLKNKLQVEAIMIRYTAGQQVIRTVSLEDRKLVASMPFRFSNIGGFTRFSFNQSKFIKGELKTAEWLISANTGRLNANITTYAALWNEPDVFSRLACNIPIFFKMRFSPQVQYSYRQKQLTMIKGEAEKRAFRNMVATVGYEYNKLFGGSGFSIGLRHNFAYAQVGVNARQTGKDMSITQTASGGILFSREKITATDRGNVGRGSILLLPFLDYNCNGKRDNNEPEITNLQVRVDGCKIERNNKKASIKITSLEAYNKYYLLLDDRNFDNPAYKIKHKTIEVTAEPNMEKQVLVPVMVMGEVSGFIYEKNDASQKGIGRVIIHIYDDRQQLAGKTISEADGYFSYLGLAPGKYTASADPVQLNKISRKNTGRPVEFTIRENRDGDIIDHLQLYIQAVPGAQL